MDICFHSGETLDIVFNAKKSSLLIIGKGYEIIYGDLYMNVFWNNAYRKVFHMNVWESVQQVIFLCERLNCVNIMLI